MARYNLEEAAQHAEERLGRRIDVVSAKEHPEGWEIEVSGGFFGRTWVVYAYDNGRVETD